MNQVTEPAASPLSDDAKRTLSILADMIIPASDEYGVPGAGDAAIVDAILADAARQRTRLEAGLSALESVARERHDAGFADLDTARRERVVDAFRDAYPAEADSIAALTAQCYYRDDRVMVSLGMDPRPPHPLGFTVEQGDWSLLDPVRARAEFYRKTE